MPARPFTSPLREWIRNNPEVRFYKDFLSANTGIECSRTDYSKARFDVLARGPKTPRIRLMDRGQGRVSHTLNGETAPFLLSDKKVGELNWREWAEYMAQGQELNARASSSQDHAHVTIPDQKEPLLIIPVSDTHIGAWATDINLFTQMTDEILALGPERARILLLGDLGEMAIKLRSVAEVTGQMIPPERQAAFVESWLDEIMHMVVAATWCNHAVEREEKGSGISVFRRMLNKFFVYHDGIGHLDITIGKETYKLAISHRFGGYSIYNKTHGPNRYLKFEGIDREIAIQGDRHTPGKAMYYDGPMKRLVITCGALNTGSTYAKRYFSLFTQPAYPCVELYPDQHLFIDYWNLADWRKAKGIE